MSNQPAAGLGDKTHHGKIVQGSASVLASYTPQPEGPDRVNRTRYYGWDGDRLVREEDPECFTRIIYAPGSFTPLLRLTRPKAGQLPIARAYAESVSGDDPALAARVMAELEQLPEPQQQAFLMELIAALVQAPDHPTPVRLHSGEGEIDDDTLLRIKRRIEQAESERPARLAYYHCDHLGTPIALTDEQGELLWQGEYDPWGNLIEERNPGGIEQLVRLPGQQYDHESGLHYNRHRYYDPATGSYITQDPIGLLGEVNFYAYVNNDPVNVIDPVGLLSSANCQALKKLVEFDDQQDSPLGTLLSEDYNALSFSDNMLGLNTDFQTIGGPVDADWMLRSAAGGLGRVPGLSHGIYGAGKMLWNAMNLRNPFSNLMQGGNLNAPSAARMWLTEGRPLREIFAPALQECGCQ